MFSHSIRTKLTGWYVGLLGVVLILFSILLYFFLSNRLYESVDNSLKVSAVVVSRSATMKFSQYPLPGLENFSNKFWVAATSTNFTESTTVPAISVHVRKTSQLHNFPCPKARMPMR